MNTSTNYCNSLTNYSRLASREVMVGNIGIGGNNPIRVQSMTTTDTMDTKATVEQAIRMIDAGCEIVRITAPSKKEAENLAHIKAELKARGYNVPLVADIHFTPNAAEIAATIVEKVRINPGNYADKKKFEELEYTNESYAAELERIKERLIPLIKICKKHGTALRIGTNHGSLSDRIMSRYGDSAIGMVESALEFLRICREQDYHEIVLSMKSSNTQVVVQAYRLLVNKMQEEGMNYPLHLGVTEAGEAEDGRIKSAVGIGTLLEDGLGDTIRVSLTEEPEFEIPVAEEILKRYKNRAGHDAIEKIAQNPLTPFEYNRRKTTSILNIGGKNVPIVMADFCGKEKITSASLFALGYQYSVPLDKWNITDTACDYVFVGDNSVEFETPGTLSVIYNHKTWLTDKDKGYPFVDVKSYLDGCELSEKLNILYITLPDLSEELIATLKTDTTTVLMIDTYNVHGMAEQRKLFIELINNEEYISADDYKEVELIGWLYQFYIADKKDDVFASFKKKQKARAEDIPAATQIFTPKWIVKYLVENTAGRIWLDKHPESPIRDTMKYLVEPEDGKPSDPIIDDVEELKVLDPAVGSGHFLVVAFDLLMQMYLESGYSKSNAVESIITHNLYGLDLCKRAVGLANFAILLKGASYSPDILTKQIKPHIYAMPEPYEFSRQQINDFLGGNGHHYADELEDALTQMQQAQNIGSALVINLSSSARDFIYDRLNDLTHDTIPLDEQMLLNVISPFLHPILMLTDSYPAVVANPPYMGSKNMNADLKLYINNHYPISKSDLFAVFMEVCTNRNPKAGLMGMINQHSWMFLSSYEKLRENVLDNFTISNMLHLGSRLFEELSALIIYSKFFSSY